MIEDGLSAAWIGVATACWNLSLDNFQRFSFQCMCRWNATADFRENKARITGRKAALMMSWGNLSSKRIEIEHWHGIYPNPQSKNFSHPRERYRRSGYWWRSFEGKSLSTGLKSGRTWRDNKRKELGLLMQLRLIFCVDEPRSLHLKYQNMLIYRTLWMYLVNITWYILKDTRTT